MLLVDPAEPPSARTGATPTLVNFDDGEHVDRPAPVPDPGGGDEAPGWVTGTDLYDGPP